jgi:hypothetical protein
VGIVHPVCHPVYNHDGSVNCFLATRPRRRGKKVFAVAFPLLEGFVFALVLGLAVAVAFV